MPAKCLNNLRTSIRRQGKARLYGPLCMFWAELLPKMYMHRLKGDAVRHVVQTLTASMVLTGIWKSLPGRIAITGFQEARMGPHQQAVSHLWQLPPHPQS